MSTQTVQETTVYAVDPAHSSVEFVVRHLMISKVRGRFGAFEGTVELEPGSDLPSSISAKIDATSVDTREPQRDAHLKSADFFDVTQFPELTFRSTGIKGSPERFTIDGELSILGVTRPVTLEATVEGRGNDPWGGQRVAYEARGTISRKDFGLTYNAALETGGVMIGDEVRIELNVEAVLQK